MGVRRIAEHKEWKLNDLISECWRWEKYVLNLVNKASPLGTNKRRRTRQEFGT